MPHALVMFLGVMKYASIHESCDKICECERCDKICDTII
jgi:hypothetical protein